MEFATAAERERRVDLLLDAYPKIASEVLMPIGEVLAEARKICRGDLEMFEILVAIGMRTAAHPEFKAMKTCELMRGEVDLLPSKRMNVRSLADSLGLPRETVRRKLNQLISDGWLQRDRGRFCVTAEGFRQLAPARRLLLRTAVELGDLVEHHAPKW